MRPYARDGDPLPPFRRRVPELPNIGIRRHCHRAYDILAGHCVSNLPSHVSTGVHDRSTKRPLGLHRAHRDHQPDTNDWRRDLVLETDLTVRFVPETHPSYLITSECIC